MCESLVQDAIRLQMSEMGEEGEVQTALSIGVPPPRHAKVAVGLMTQAAQRCLKAGTSQNGLALQYGPALGDLQFRDVLAKYLTKEYRVPVERDNLQIVCGATHALSIVTSTFFKSDSPIFIENPCYYASIGILRDDHHMNVIPVKCDEDGMRMDDLESQIKRHVSSDDANRNPMFSGMIYTISVYHNPAGYVLPPVRCRHLVEIARKYNLLVFADDVYNLLHYDQEFPHPKTLDFDHESDSDYQSNVLSCGSFSKTFGPGLRLGWIEAKGRIIKYLADRRLLFGSGAYNHYVSLVFRELIESGEFHTHKENLRQDMKDMKAYVDKLLQEHLPTGCSYSTPGGGLFLWVTMPAGCNADELNDIIIKKYKLSVGPGSEFSADHSFNHSFRLGFGFYDKDILKEAVKNLSEGIKQHIKEKQAKSH